LFEWLFFLPRGIRGQAVSRLELEPGSRVLEVGTGTGRNLADLVDAVGAEGRVYGVDFSDGMLAEAEKLCSRHDWHNVRLIQADAAEYDLPETVDGVIFSLSYAVIPRREAALLRAWAQLRPGSYLVIMDAKLPSGFRGKLLGPIVTWASRLTVLGDPTVCAWDDLKTLNTEVEVEEVQFGTYFIARVRKPR